MTWINMTWSQKAATVTPSPPAPVSPDNSAQASRQEPQEVKAAASPPQPQQHEATPDVESTAEVMKAAAEQIEAYLRSTGRALEFRVDDSTGRTIVTVLDSETGQTVRQIPGEEVLRVARNLGAQPSTFIDLVV